MFGKYKMKEPLIGILMATYNGERFIREQINSILNQTYENWKLIIHDDGSTDSTVNIVKEYVKKYPEKIILIEDGIRCGGAKENFAHLINIAKAKFNFDYIMFSDQDDVWLPNKIEITLQKMIEVETQYKNTPIIVHTDLTVVDANLNIIAKSFWEYQTMNPWNNTIACLLLENTVTGCTMMINKNLFEKIIIFPKEAICHDSWIALVCSAIGGVIARIKAPTVLYRQHGKNVTGARRYNLFISLRNFIFDTAGVIKRGKDRRKKLRSQAKALIWYINNYLPDKKTKFISQLEDALNNPLRIKIFYVKEKALCGPIFKKIKKFLFY